MTSPMIKTKVLQEIDLIPEDKRADVYNVQIPKTTSLYRRRQAGRLPMT